MTNNRFSMTNSQFFPSSLWRQCRLFLPRRLVMERANHNGPAARAAADVERRPDHLRAIIHDVQPHARAELGAIGKTDAVVLHRQNDFLVDRAQADGNVFATSVLE